MSSPTSVQSLLASVALAVSQAVARDRAARGLAVRAHHSPDEGVIVVTAYRADGTLLGQERIAA